MEISVASENFLRRLKQVYSIYTKLDKAGILEFESSESDDNVTFYELA